MFEARSHGWDSRLTFLVIVCHGRLSLRKQERGIPLAVPIAVKFFCRHCDRVVTGKPYRVLSEENGVVLLDMTVCRSCRDPATSLGLHSEELPADVGRTRHRRRWMPAAAQSAGH